jgi:hypothetical protein
MLVCRDGLCIIRAVLLAMTAAGGLGGACQHGRPGCLVCGAWGLIVYADVGLVFVGWDGSLTAPSTA